MFYTKGITSKIAIAALALGVSACSSQKKADDSYVVDDTSLETTDLSLDDLQAETSENADASYADANAEASTDESQFATEDTNTTTSTSSNYSSNGAAYTKSSFPKVATKPFEKDGFLMNAFYFVQSDQETYSTLSQLFYGRPERAEMIASWNGSKKLSPGTVVYYNSHLRFRDSEQMLSFYDDFGFEWNAYQVKAGDTLSGIAKQLYNDVNAWRNLAAFNPELRSPDVLVIGQALRLPPLNIDTSAKLQDTAQSKTASTQHSDEPSALAQPQAPVISDETIEDAANVQPVQTLESDQVEQDERAEQSTTADKGIANIEESLRDNLNSMGDKQKHLYLGVALITLTVLLVLLRRRSAKAKS